MSEPIRVNDLVMVVRAKPCCGSTRRMGAVFTVGQIDSGYFSCKCCKEVRRLTTVKGDIEGRLNIARLIRIDPPATDETTETPAELTA